MDGELEMQSDAGRKVVKTEDEVLEAAAKDFDYAYETEGTFRRNFREDWRFAHGDAYNMTQWPDDILTARRKAGAPRPCLTISKVATHNNIIINDLKRNKPGIKFRAMGGGASYESARIYDALAKHLEARSSAGMVYDKVIEFTVEGGFAYGRIDTEFVSEDSFDQDARIRLVDDPLMVVDDPDAKEPDKLDRKFLLVFQDLEKGEAKRKYKKFGEVAGQQPLGNMPLGWISSDKVRVAEYWRREEEEDELFVIQQPDGGLGKFYRSDFEVGGESRSGARGMLRELNEAVERGEGKKRAVTRSTVKRWIIVGQKVVGKEEVWPGKYIPFALCCGREVVVDGKKDRISHTRGMLDAQRSYNYMASAAAEYVALQGKTQWLTPMATYSEFQQYYNSANTTNYAILPYNVVDDDGNALPPPTRIDPPVPMPAAITGMQVAENQLMMSSGQYQSSLGQGSNERSGTAINERQLQGESATYHFPNSLAQFIQTLGKIFADIAPKIYDTSRVFQLMAHDGSEFELMMDPEMAQAYQKRMSVDGKVVEHFFNPAVGRYEVLADVGPSYGTRRQEAMDKLGVLITQAPQLTQVIGDLLLRCTDIEYSDEAAARLRRMVPKEALGEGPSQSEQALSAQVQQLTGLLESAMQSMAEQQLKLKGREQQRNIDVYNALTARLKVLFDTAVKSAGKGDDEEAQSAVEKLMFEAVKETLDATLSPILAANEETMGQGEFSAPKKTAVLGALAGGRNPL